MNIKRKSNISLHITANTAGTLRKMTRFLRLQAVWPTEGTHTHTHTRRSRSDFKGFRGIYFTGETFQWFVVFSPRMLAQFSLKMTLFPLLRNARNVEAKDSLLAFWD